MKKVIVWCLALQSLALVTNAQENLVPYVHPLIGTYKMGHTYPGATVPFGMVQLSPETDTIPYAVDGHYNPLVYKYCAGYQYEDKTIVGFTHTHFSGTGHSDLGDFLVMPTVGTLQMNPGTEDNPKSGFRSAFSHEHEKAEANYYQVMLEDDHILAEMTTTTRVGFHQYTFPQSDDAHIILDLMYGIYNYDDKNVWTFVRVENDTLVTGYRQTNGWARTRVMYFAMSFSKPFKTYGAKNFSDKQAYRGFWGRFNQEENFPALAGERLRMHFDFATTEGEKIKVKVALSPVSTAGAIENLDTETPHWDFEAVKKAGQDTWNKALHKIEAETITEDDKVSFYTALYHTFLAPTTYMDVNGLYRGLDQGIHKADGFVNYTTFSLWDTYRALHPFFNIVQPSRNADMARSMLAHYNQSTLHMLPIWSHHANENWCMIGYHSVPVIADAIITGALKADKGQLNQYLDACVTTAKQPRFDGLNYYMAMGYVPEDKNGASVSKTLEYAYDDWTIAQLAKKLGRTDLYNEFIQRSGNWKNVYDPATGYMRPKLSNGEFRKGFDALSTHGQGYIEGNAWNYSLYVPHDPAAMIEKMGGKKQFSQHLDSLFTMELPDEFFAHTEDITREGIIGNYVHGNEPAHHAAYLYHWTGEPWKTQERVRMILRKQYGTAPDGLSGNDDCGQMSAWYLFTALGFYPVAPGSDQYIMGSPLVKAATLNLENGKTFKIEAKGQSDKNVYVKKVELNGKVIDRNYLTYEDIIQGGTLVYYMSRRPTK